MALKTCFRCEAISIFSAVAASRGLKLKESRAIEGFFNDREIDPEDQKQIAALADLIIGVVGISAGFINKRIRTTPRIDISDLRTKQRQCYQHRSYATKDNAIRMKAMVHGSVETQLAAPEERLLTTIPRPPWDAI